MASILLIDDDRLVRASVKLQLELGGHVVTAVDDGGEGLRVFKPGEFEVVLTDIIMPGVEGVETVRRLRRIDSQVVIIAMTGGAPILAGNRSGSAPDYLKMVSRLGATATIRKPFTGSALLALIAENLAASQASADAANIGAPS